MEAVTVTDRLKSEIELLHGAMEKNFYYHTLFSINLPLLKLIDTTIISVSPYRHHIQFSILSENSKFTYWYGVLPLLFSFL